MSKKKTYLVTGGAGFIGSHVCARLMQEEQRVVCVDNLSSGRKQHIQEFFSSDNFTFIEHNIVEPFYSDEKIDRIFHLACPASPVAYQNNPIATIKTNVLGTINVLGLARKHDARLLLASTSEVYGDPLEHPQKETYRGNVNTLGPRACYDEGKRCAETLCMDYHRTHGMDVAIARIFNTYGPHMAPDDGRVVSNFIVQALMGQKLTVYGDGSQTRSFQYVDDLVDGLMRLMEKDGFIGPVNIGNDKEYTIKELAGYVARLTDSDMALEQKPLPEDDPTRRRPDITVAQKELGWSPRVSLEDGLAKTVSYFRTIVR